MNVRYHGHKIPQVISVLSQINPVHSTVTLLLLTVSGAVETSRYQMRCILAMYLHFLSHDIPNLLPRILTLFIYQVTWTIFCRPLLSPHSTTATTFNHTSVRHSISILQMVATSTKTALHASVF